MIGRIFSQYEITEKLGSGGMGVVYKAYDSALDRFVALKFLPPEFNADAEAEERFVQEAHAAAGLDHPSICTVHEIDETGDSSAYGESQRFIAMAYYEGQTLDRRIKEGPLPREEALRIATKVTQGLAHAHAAGVVHRDIKPSNIMLTDSGDVKILDFGIAKLTGRTNFTRVGSTLGTAAYMSPEQARGETVDGRSDLWSVGVILYQMLSGRAPFEGEFDQAIIFAILNEEPAALEDEGENLQAVVGRLLAKHPIGRYQDCDTLLADLKTLRAGGEVRRPRKWTRGIVGMILALTIVGIGARWIVSGLTSSEQPPVATASTDELDIFERIAVLPFTYTGSEENSWLGRGLMDLMNTNLSGTQNGYTVAANAVQFAIEEMDSSQARLDGAEVAEFLNVRHFVRGEIVAVGEDLRISAELHDRSSPSEDPVRGEVSGPLHDLYGMVDVLAGQLLVGTSHHVDRRDAEQALGTTNLKALKWYLVGLEYGRAWNRRAASQAFLNAVAADSNFALAWYNLSLWQDYVPGACIPAANRAIELSVGLPERDRLLMVGRLAELEGDYDRSEDIYLRILRDDPRDMIALLEVEGLLWTKNKLRGRSWYEAAPFSRRFLELAPEYGGGSRLILDYLAIDTADLEYLAANPLCNGRAETLCQVSKWVQAYDQDPESVLDVDGQLSWYRIKEFDWLRSDPSVSLELTERMAAPESPQFRRFNARWILAQLNTARGQYRAAQAHLDSAVAVGEPWATEYPGAVHAAALAMRAFCAAMPFIDLPPGETESLLTFLEAWDADSVADHANHPTSLNNGLHSPIRLYLLGLLTTRNAEFARAAQYADELVELASERPEEMAILDQASGIRARIAFERGDAAEALSLLEGVPRQYEHWRGHTVYFSTVEVRLLRGEALFALGRYDEALEWFRSLRTSAHSLFNAVRFYHQARCLEALGDHEAAITDYQEFIDLWRDCDPDQRRLVDGALQRLALLGGQGES